METMEIKREEEIIDMSLSRAMQISGGNSFGHSIDFMPQGNGRNWSSENDIEDDPSPSVDRPLPIYLKFEDLQFNVKNIQANPVKAVVSSQLNTEKEKYKYILKGITGSVKVFDHFFLVQGFRMLNPQIEEGIRRVLAYLWLETQLNPGVSSSQASSSYRG